RAGRRMRGYAPRMDAAVGIDLLRSGKAFVDVSAWRSVAVSGSEAIEWLNDLVSAELEELRPSTARRSLLLSPTGGILAEFTVTVIGGTVMLIQDPAQPRSIATLLEPYVLSSDVQLQDRTGHLGIFAFPGRTIAPDVPGTAWSSPSCLGAGVDIVSLHEDHARLATSFAKVYLQATNEDAEAWRIATGNPRIGVDTEDGDLPQEARLEGAVSYDKGCFLGQEAVAKMRNLGHPRRWVAALEGSGSVPLGEMLSAGDEETGVVTSVTHANGTALALARIRWQHRDAVLRTTRGVELRPRVPA
ncbi:MAG: YgfZ/GcvT domain-containing protein, partial [Actinomycetota bacterium]